MKKIIATALSCVCLLTCVACQNDSTSKNSVTSPDSSSSSALPTVTVTKENAIVYKGKSDYKIVVSENMSNNDGLAVSELNTILYEAVGLKLDVCKDTEVTWTEDAKYISIGANALLKSLEIELDDDELYRSGYVIKTVGKSFFLSGRSEGLSYGSMYAVYDWLYEFFNYEYFAKDCYSLNRNVFDVAFKAVNKVEIPDIAQRSISSYTLNANEEYMRRLRLEKQGDDKTWITVGHSLHDYMNPDTYLADHPDWYSSDGKALCLTNEEARAELIGKLKNAIDSNPNGIVVHLGQADVDSYCKCDTCALEMETKYMNMPGMYIGFTNKVSDDLTPWLEENYPGREFLITSFNYMYSEGAPCVMNEETGEWEPFSEYVVPRDNVGVYWAPIRMDYSKPIYEIGGSNEASKRAIDGLYALFGEGRIYEWSYCTNFRNYLINYNNFGGIAENYKYSAEHGVKYIMDQGPSDSGTPTFEELRLYIQAKLMWDTSLDVYDLAKHFIEYYYGEASDAIWTYFTQLNSYYAYLGEKFNLTGDINNNLSDGRYWPIGTLNSFAQVIQQGLSDIEASALTAEEKLAYSNRVNRLYVTIDYLYLLHYSGNFSTNQVKEIFTHMEKYCNMYDIINVAEVTSLSSFFEKYR